MKFSSVLVLAAIAGTSSAASTCCNAVDSEGCTDPAFPAQQLGTNEANGVQFIICCASADNFVNNVGNNPACAGSIPLPAPTPSLFDNTEDDNTFNTEDNNTSNTGDFTFGGSSPGMADLAASCEALESQFQDCTCSVQCKDGETKCLEADSEGCSDAAKTFCVGQGSSVYLSCGHTKTYSESSSTSETYSESHSSTTTTTTTGSAPSPTPSAGFASSTSVAIDASVAFLAMIFV